MTVHKYDVGTAVPWRGRTALVVGHYHPDSLLVPEGETGYTCIVQGSFERVTLLEVHLDREGFKA